MTKIKNRFTGDLITVHDNLLCDLYGLSVHTSVSLKEINNYQCLFNEIKGKGYSIGLYTKIPEKLLVVDGETCHFDDLNESDKESIIDSLSDKLEFSFLEIFVANILFDKFLKVGHPCKTSIKELEGRYRKSKNDYSKVRITENVFNRYIDILERLVDKKMFLKTSGYFRSARYGVRNIDSSQMFLTVYDVIAKGKNNIEFSFSFGNFGRVIKNCRRYSNTLSCRALDIRFNQAKKYVTAFYIARKVFIKRGELNKERNFTLDENVMIFTYNYYSNEVCGATKNSEKYVPNKLRLFRQNIEYTLEALKHCNIRDDQIEEIYSYDMTEDFEDLHEFDFDIKGDLNYDFSIKDISRDVSLTLRVKLTDY